MPVYDKLVRDKIPEIIKEQGKTCEFYVADKEEYGRRLIEKMREEISEFEEDPSRYYALTAEMRRLWICCAIAQIVFTVKTHTN